MFLVLGEVDGEMRDMNKFMYELESGSELLDRERANPLVKLTALSLQNSPRDSNGDDIKGFYSTLQISKATFRHSFSSLTRQITSR